MQHLVTVTEPAREREIVDYSVCDLCGDKIEDKDYDVDEVEIRRVTGYRYPGGGWSEELEVDVCGKCFDDKVLPWLKREGAKPRTTERDWG